MLPRSRYLTAVLLASAGFAATPALADRCDDTAAQLKSQIDGVAIGRTVANTIYLSHPAAKQLRLGCPSRTISNELFASADGRKPKPEFFELVASAAAIVFTIPKADTLRGAKRCIGRLGLLRGDEDQGRFRRLDMRCSRSKTEASISISRGKDE
uniref:Uncharacterized protein n=1 Tax=Rhodopseudomonas palustris (strain BisA53) TaxID=316055 RepID=Q07RB9_RHOP5